MKVILIILGIIIVVMTIVSAYANGFLRALRIMSERRFKRTEFDKHLIKHAYEKNGNRTDPYFQNIYMQDAHTEFLKEVAEKTKTVKKAKSKAKSNVKKRKK